MAELSIIIPVYNKEKYIDRCVKSVLSQTFSDFELIIVNDGSKDNSADICKKYVQSDSRVVYIEKKNGGASSAKNAGIKAAKGKYCEFVDADDYLDASYVENLMRGVKEYNADLCVGNIKFISGTNERSCNLHEGFFEIKEYLGFYSEYMPYAIVGAPYNKIFKVNVLRDSNILFNENLTNNEDTHFNYDYLLNCKSVYVSPTPFYNYVFMNSSLSHRYIPDLPDICLSTYEKSVNTLKTLDAYDVNKNFCRKYFLNQVINMFCNIVDYSPETFKSKIKKLKYIVCSEKVRAIIFEGGKPINLSKRDSLIFFLIRVKSFSIIYFIFSLRKGLKG